jgi:flagellar FliL protein
MANEKETKPETPPAEPEKTKTRVKLPPKVLIIVGVLLVQLVGSYFLQKTFLFGSVSAPAIATEKVEEKTEANDDAMKVVMLDEIIVNPAATGGRRYLAVTAGLQTATPEAEKKLDEQRALVRDVIISLLSAKHLDQLASISYRDSLKAELKSAINAKVHGVKIENVVFSGYVLQ